MSVLAAEAVLLVEQQEADNIRRRCNRCIPEETADYSRNTGVHCNLAAVGEQSGETVAAALNVGTAAAVLTGESGEPAAGEHCCLTVI